MKGFIRYPAAVPSYGILLIELKGGIYHLCLRFGKYEKVIVLEEKEVE